MSAWRRALRIALSSGIALLLTSGVEAAGEAPDYSALSIGVAPFESVAPGGGDVPDIAAELANALDALGVGRVVGPEQLGAPALAEPAADPLRAAAEAASVRAVVVGRTTRLGNRYSVDVRLRSGITGAVAATYVAEVPVTDELAPAVGGLAQQIARAVLELEERGGLSVVVAPTRRPAPLVPPAAPKSRRPSDGQGTPFGLWSFDSKAPLSIRADELEATDKQGARTLRFRDGVRVEQGDMTLVSDRLQAFYEAGAKEPHRLVAEGNVALSQDDRGARCQKAVYERAKQRIVCQGEARLHDGSDTVEGTAIEFDLASDRVFVRGGTRLSLGSSQGATATPGAAPAVKEEGEAGGDSFGFGQLEGDAPIAVRSETLAAFEADEVRQLLFEGGVEVTQGDLTIRSERLEAVYPRGERRPDRLVAIGDVALHQGGREVECERAVYHRLARRVDCIGTAVLREGGDEVEGELIEFDLAAKTVVVTGRTRLRMNQPVSAGPESAVQ